MSKVDDAMDDKSQETEPAVGEVIRKGREILFQGYAYVLTHPGIPTVFYDHFYGCGEAMHDQIVKLMNIRKSQDIHSRSAIRILDAKPDLYAAIVDDKVCMKIGNGSWCPKDGEWTLATSGHNYAVWHK